MRLTEEGQQNEYQWQWWWWLEGRDWQQLWGAAYLHRGHRRCVWGDRAALTGGGPVGRRPSGRRPGSAASVAEARHHLSGSLWEDELLPQLHVGPAFSWGTMAQSTTRGKNGPPSSFHAAWDDNQHFEVPHSSIIEEESDRFGVAFHKI